jgi:dnd system-associated protein 4
MVIEAEGARRDRVYCEASQLEIYRELAGTGESGRKKARGAQLPPFKSLKDAFLIAVCLGVKFGRRIPLKQRRELALLSYFNEHQDMAVLRAIAIAEAGNVEVLVDQNQILTTAEEYANGGFEELRRAAWGVAIPLQNLVELLIENEVSQSSD